MSLWGYLGLDTRNFDSGVDRAKVNARGLGNELKKSLSSGKGGLGTQLVSEVKGMAGQLVGMAAIAKAASSSFKQAMSAEQSTASFEVLLKSADKAKARLAELDKFAAETPFQLPEVVQASKTLEVLTRGALSTGSGLRMVGDAASFADEHITDIAVYIGRAYEGLRSGREVGESLMRLQELGLVSGTARSRIETLQKAGEKGSKVWQVLADELARVNGQMQRQMQTGAGKLSNLEDAFGRAQREIGTPLLNAIKPIIDALTATTEGGKSAARQIGEFVGGVVSVIRLLVGGTASTLGALWEGAATVITSSGSAIAKAFKGDFAGALQEIKNGMADLGYLGRGWTDSLADFAAPLIGKSDPLKSQKDSLLELTDNLDAAAAKKQKFDAAWEAKWAEHHQKMAEISGKEDISSGDLDKQIAALQAKKAKLGSQVFEAAPDPSGLKDDDDRRLEALDFELQQERDMATVQVEIEARQRKMAEMRQSAAKKESEAREKAMTDEKRLLDLQERRAALAGQVDNTTEKGIKAREQVAELDGEIATLKKSIAHGDEKVAGKVTADSLARIGGGGNIATATGSVQTGILTAARQQVKQLDDIRRLLSQQRGGLTLK